MTHKRVVIYSGGQLHEEDWKEIQANDFIIGADRGALYLMQHHIPIHLAVGDFDSILPEQLHQIEDYAERLLACDAVDKDLTDTELAIKLALEQQPDEILLLGATGTRMDHTLANIQLLMQVLQHRIPCSIKDSNNYIMLTDSLLEVKSMGYPYISLLPLSSEVTGITLKGFQYPLVDATLKLGQSLGISNHLAGDAGLVTICSGVLLVIQSRD
ncbi:thiamine diphosphokinase [Paenibacillus massiliensis]|uniref:thiamine diphosphokinase n=1 Tax=Paenibacillus massiliensis TaxID=225917 RepID=UPI000402C404|nr:thiamine diphosphokinase [Paenibacillus massiliensis]